MRALACVVVLFGGIAEGQTVTLRKRAVSAREIRGAALGENGRLFTWGDGLQSWTLPDLKPRSLAAGNFGEGGCLVDLDGDGQQELVTVEGSGLGKLTWRKPPKWTPVVIDDQFETHDCLEATLFGRKGVLVIQRYMQVRFYERTDRTPWAHREIYSIYTPSQQTGLSLRDVDGDGRSDIVCGNYWIQSPESFELPWRIFAINTWFEEPLSAMLAHAFDDGRLLMAQTHMADARVALFAKPEDPRKLWTEMRLPGDFHRVHAVAAIEGTVLFGENNGAASRLFALGEGRARVLFRAFDFLGLIAMRGGFVGVGPRAIGVFEF